MLEFGIQPRSSSEQLSSVFILKGVVVIHYRRFGTNSRSHLRWPRFFLNSENETCKFLNTKDRNDSFPRNICNILQPLTSQYLRTAQLSVPLSFFPCSIPKPLTSKRHCLCSVTMNNFPVRWTDGTRGSSRVLLLIMSLEFLITYSFWPHFGPGIDTTCYRSKYQEYFMG